MKITTMTVGKRYTINLGNFNSAQIHFELTTEVDENDDIGNVKETLTDMVGEYISNEIDQLDADDNSG